MTLYLTYKSRENTKNSYGRVYKAYMKQLIYRVYVCEGVNYLFIIIKLII